MQLLEKTLGALKRLARGVIPTSIVPTSVVREERRCRESQGGAALNGYLRDKFCEKPFVDFEISNNGNVFVCCPNHLPQPIGSVKTAKGDELVNSEMARAVRRSIIDGSFAFCDAQRCPMIMQKRLPKRSDISDPEMLEHIRRNTGIVQAPRHVRLSYDSTCNLWCPSCRKEQIVLKGADFDEAIRITDEVALPVLKGARTVMMNGYGDIFSSRICRHLLDEINPTDYPDLKLLFITNGVLLTEKECNKFPNIHGMVHSIRVSIDAATKPVYDVLRLGGNFDRLCKNLEFIARLRRERTINEFMISMVVQCENFREMEPFWQWGKQLGCDFIIYEWLQNWLTYAAPDYDARAVHLRTHPLHAEYLSAVAALQQSAKTGGPTIAGDLTS
ncbi:MAG: SPASM domain-containing protein [Acidobacteriaceae bacterium]